MTNRIVIILCVMSGFLFASCAADEFNAEIDIGQNSELTALLGKCPVDIFVGPSVEFSDDQTYCASNQTRCLKRCSEGDANSCFNLGLNLQSDEGLRKNYSESLFAKSCQSGLILGCTNRAAGMRYVGDQNANKDNICSARTFEFTCSHDDEWGCAMYGVALVGGEGVEKNKALAETYIAKTCKLDPGGDPCVLAESLRGE